MSKKDQLDNQIEGQMTIADLFAPPERLFAVSRIFARARKHMSLNEQKAFVYALSQIDFKDDIKNNHRVKLDKKTLANIIGLSADPDHLSGNLYDEIKDLPQHSYIEIAEPDLDIHSNGFLVTNVTRFKNMIRVNFNDEYLPFFASLTTNYLTMWSTDIFRMKSRRSVQFYEFLRQNTDDRKHVNDIGLGIKAFKELFDIPKEAYMREKGGFNRTEFEKRVIDTVCSDLVQTKMIRLIIQPNGKYYEKIKRGNRVDGYRFYWEFTARPAVATAHEVAQIQERVDKDPQILKVAKDIVSGEKKPKKSTFTDFDQRDPNSDPDVLKALKKFKNR